MSDSLSLLGQEGFRLGKHELGKHNVLSVVNVGCGNCEQMGIQNIEILRSYIKFYNLQYYISALW